MRKCEALENYGTGFSSPLGRLLYHIVISFSVATFAPEFYHLVSLMNLLPDKLILLIDGPGNLQGCALKSLPGALRSLPGALKSLPGALEIAWSAGRSSQEQTRRQCLGHRVDFSGHQVDF